MTTIQNSTAYWVSTANAVAAANTLTSSTATTTATTESKKKPRWKWSGEDTPFDLRCWNDEEDEKGYDDDAYAYEVDCDDHAFLNEEEEEESDKHQFGLCWSCKKGLDDRADFVCDDRDNGAFFFMCTDCYEGYSQPWYHHHHEERQGVDP
jgi:hypothetical protein